MSWQSYVDNLMSDGTCIDAAVVGYCNDKSIWASYKEGTFRNITPAEIDALLSTDRDSLFIKGVTIGGEKYSVIRDSFHIEDDWTMDLRTKRTDGGTTYQISIGKALTALIFAKGNTGVHGGTTNKMAYTMTNHLRKNSC